MFGVRRYSQSQQKPVGWVWHVSPDWDACAKFGMGPSRLCNGWPWTNSGQPAAAYIWALWWQSGWPEKWSKNRPLYNKCPEI